MSPSSSATTPTENAIPAKSSQRQRDHGRFASDTKPPFQLSKRIRLAPAFLASIRDSKVYHAELAIAAGFPHLPNLSWRLYNPFPATDLMLTRFTRLAEIINYTGPLFVDEATPMNVPLDLPEELAAQFATLRPVIARALVVALPHLSLVTACRVVNDAVDKAISGGDRTDLLVLQAMINGVRLASEKAEKAETP